MYTIVNPTLLDIFKASRKQFHVPITATITDYNTLATGQLLGSGTIQLPAGDVFLCRGIFASVIDDNGLRLTLDAPTYDLIQVNIVDASTGYTFTNGMTDIMALANRGLGNDYFWGFYPQQNLTVTFQATQVGAVAGSAAPWYAEVVLWGERYPQGDYPQEVKAIRELSSLQ